MKRILPLLLLCVGFLFGCEPDTEIEYRTVVDSVFVHRVDTVYIDRTDTVFVSQTDTVVVTQTDTVVTVVNHTDTIVEVRLDTVLLVRNDTVLVNAQKLLLRTDRQSLVLDSVSRVDRLTVESDVLESLVCDSVGLSELELRTPHLRRLRCAHNRLEKLDVPSCLYELDCRYNDLSLLDLSAFPPQLADKNDEMWQIDSVCYHEDYSIFDHLTAEYFRYYMENTVFDAYFRLPIWSGSSFRRFEPQWNYEAVIHNESTLLYRLSEDRLQRELVPGYRYDDPDSYFNYIYNNNHTIKIIPSGTYKFDFETILYFPYMRCRPQRVNLKLYLSQHDKFSVFYYFRYKEVHSEMRPDADSNSDDENYRYIWNFRWEDTDVYMK